MDRQLGGPQIGRGATSSADLASRRVVGEPRGAEEELAWQHDTQRAMNSLLRASLEAGSLGEVLDHALGVVLEVPGLDLEPRGCIYIVEDEPGVLVRRAALNQEAPVTSACARVPFGWCLCGRAAETQEVQFADRVDERHEVRREDLGPHGDYCVPIAGNGETLGVLGLYVKEGHARDDNEVAFLTAVANTLAGVILRHRSQAEKEEMEARLHQAQKMEAVGHLAGGVAHDFNNILQAIFTHLDFALAGMAPEDERYEDLRGARAAANRAATLTRQLLAFSRRQVLEKRSLDLNGVVTDLARMLRRVIGEHVELEIQTGQDVAAVLADRGQVEQVLMNLVVNARDAMPRGGTIRIETSDVTVGREFCETHPWAREGPFVLLSVADTGVGMAPEVQEQIFQPFFTTKGRGRGTGLGLATVYGIVKQHDGFFELESVPGRGTRFDTYLPVADGVAAADSDSCGHPAVQGTEAVLVVEDDAAVRRSAVRILENLGYAVHEAADGQEALGMIVGGATVDLVLSDVVMPRMGGRELLEHARKKAPGLVFLFSSGYTAEAFDELLTSGAGVSFIAKPYTAAQLGRAVCEAMGGGS